MPGSMLFSLMVALIIVAVMSEISPSLINWLLLLMIMGLLLAQWGRFEPALKAVTWFTGGLDDEDR